jgi:hypothetical protein
MRAAAGETVKPRQFPMGSYAVFGPGFRFGERSRLFDMDISAEKSMISGVSR